MNKSILFFLLMFFLSVGFVESNERAEEGGEQQRQFLEFLSYFEKVSLPYSVDLKTYEQRQFSKSARSKKANLTTGDQKFTKIAHEFLPSVRAGKFSRMGRPLLQPIARFFPDDKTVAVIYSSKLQFNSAMISDYTLVYFDLKGNLLGGSRKKGLHPNDRRIGFTNQHHAQTFTILPSGKIETVFYDNHWKAKAGSMPYEQNELLGFKKVKTVTYELAGARGIQEIAQVDFITTRP